MKIVIAIRAEMLLLRTKLGCIDVPPGVLLLLPGTSVLQEHETTNTELGLEVVAAIAMMLTVAASGPTRPKPHVTKTSRQAPIFVSATE